MEIGSWDPELVNVENGPLGVLSLPYLEEKTESSELVA